MERLHFELFDGGLSVLRQEVFRALAAVVLQREIGATEDEQLHELLTLTRCRVVQRRLTLAILSSKHRLLVEMGCGAKRCEQVQGTCWLTLAPASIKKRQRSK